jgi:hypothetical protein
MTLSVFRYSGSPAERPSSPIQLGAPPPMQMVYGDWPKLFDNDPEFALYLAGGGANGWLGGSIYRSDDGGQSYVDDADFPIGSTIGTAVSALGSGPWWALDRGNTVNVALVDTTRQLNSVTEQQVMEGTANAAMLGGELIQFVNAALQGNGSYLLDTLYRGRRGTEWAISGHSIGETFVLLDPTLVYDQLAAGDIGIQRVFKPLNFKQDISTAAAENHTYAGLCMKPWAPTFIAGNRDASGNLTITWQRRSRIGDTWLATGDPLLGETAESYVIQMWNDAATAVVATYTATTNSLSYSAAQQTTDFGAVKWGLNVAICQVSGYVGNGYFSPITGI